MIGIVGRIAAAFLVAVGLIVGATAVNIWWTARQDERPVADAILVLGSAQYNGTPSPIFEARLDHALDLYNAGVAPLVITVGGRRDGDLFTEAEAGLSWLAREGIPEEALRAVPDGADTLQSIQAVAALFAEQGLSTAVLVTDPWHALRATRIAQDAGIVTSSSPTRQGPAVQTRSTQFRYIVRETAAYLVYRLTGSSVAGAPGID
ncbi:MAG: YdcF family protein [Geodermatophilaceae bacterium]|nr:YdcF family protein [Geodermatophilaceae bacterium]